ncbi:MAG: hypothetical protein M3392_04240 [Actinomycetota bacterium]|nr:hypothetical protein [Actinomycetota bacterium]MDQ5819794.1 hypothetical protein [Actinomycetota bacterium]
MSEDRSERPLDCLPLVSGSHYYRDRRVVVEGIPVFPYLAQQRDAPDAPEPL